MPKTKAASTAIQDAPITDAIPKRKNVVGRQVSYVTFEGAEPDVGSTIEFTAINGIKYRATVADSVTVDGKVTCELSDGPHVAQK